MIFLLITILTILIIIVLSLNIKFEIKNLKINIPKDQEKITNKESKVYLKIYTLKKIKIAEFNLKKIDFKDEKIRNKLQKQVEKNKINLDTIKFLKSVNYIIEKMNLSISIGTEDSAITALSVGIFYTIISNFLNEKVRDLNDIKYEIKPIYNNKNMLNIELDSIIALKFENIINMIKFLKKGSAYKNDKSSNRKSYAYSNE